MQNEKGILGQLFLQKKNLYHVIYGIDWKNQIMKEESLR